MEVLSVRSSAAIAICEAFDDAFTEGKVELVPVPVGDLREGATDAVEPFMGKLAQRSIGGDEQLAPEDAQAPDALPIPAGQVAASVQLAVGAEEEGHPEPGDWVELSLRHGGEILTVAESALVLAVGCADGLPLSTLALSRKQADDVWLASTLGRLRATVLDPATGEVP